MTLEFVNKSDNTVKQMQNGLNSISFESIIPLKTSFKLLWVLRRSDGILKGSAKTIADFRGLLANKQ